MNKTLALLLAASCLTAVGQVEISYPYNPDNGDGAIGSPDLIALLTLYGTLFEPEALMVNEIPFQDWVDSVNNTLLSQQATIDSLMLNNSSTSLSEFIPCEPSDFYVVVSDTIWPSEFNCGCGCNICPGYCEDTYYGSNLGVDESNLGEYLDALILNGNYADGGRITHVFTFEQTCNSVDYQRFDEVFEELELFSYSENYVYSGSGTPYFPNDYPFEQALFILPEVSNDFQVETKGRQEWFPKPTTQSGLTITASAAFNGVFYSGCQEVSHVLTSTPVFAETLLYDGDYQGPEAPSVVYRTVGQFENGIWSISH